MTDDDTALRRRAEKYARTFVTQGVDPGEALLRGFGKASAEAHTARCPQHTADTCVDLQEPATPDDPERLTGLLLGDADPPHGWIL